MRRIGGILIVIAVVLPMCFSCRTISSILHDEQVVAKVGRHRLYKSDLDKAIPKADSPQDSVALALRYIDIWATDLVFLDVAQTQLSKSDKDVSKELEDYRRSLLRYRYEQKYVNERLDTAVTEDEMNDYYDSHKEQFVVEIPIMKVRYMRIPENSPDLDRIKRLMSSSKVGDIAQADSLAYFSAAIYTDYNGQWINAVQLAKNFGTDYVTLLSKVKRSKVEMEDGNGMVNVAYIEDFIAAGEDAPVEYCYDRIRDIVISRRKQALISELERDLLDDARAKGKLEIL